ncbi:MAG TPA: S8 family serine peptidase [Actinomycetota bacterium]|nr:S8 family serine peptidase [Actinomycetota bacterium]
MRTRIWHPLAAVVVCALLAVVAPTASAATDQFADSLWGMQKIRARAAWAAGTGKGVTVAIIDSGVDPNHEDLAKNIVGGYDVVDKDFDPRDEEGHGTHVAGIVAAVANNGLGVAGVAPAAKIMPIRVLDTDGAGSQSDIEDGVHWAVDHGAQVVNLSLGADVIVEFLSGGTLTDAVNYAWSKGVIPVVSAGNDGLFRSELRGAKALVVTATTPDDRIAPYATGVGFAEWGIAAPGGTDDGGEKNMILSTFWDRTGKRKYAYQMGTSMAAPHVAGAAALLRGMGLSPQQTVNRLLSTAKDLGPRGRDSTFGAGRLDVKAATLGQAGATGRPGRPGSSAAGSSATGAPGANASGTRGAPGRLPVPIEATTSTPSSAPSAAATGTSTPAERIEESGGILPWVLLGAGAAGAAAIAGFLLLRHAASRG